MGYYAFSTVRTALSRLADFAGRLPLILVLELMIEEIINEDTEPKALSASCACRAGFIFLY
jgi:hypothetical protein